MRVEQQFTLWQDGSITYAEFAKLVASNVHAIEQAEFTADMTAWEKAEIEEAVDAASNRSEAEVEALRQKELEGGEVASLGAFGPPKKKVQKSLALTQETIYNNNIWPLHIAT